MCRLRLLILFLAFQSWQLLSAQSFEQHFADRTLRIDYTFSGNSRVQQLYVDELHQIPHWYGKRRRLKELPLKGNGDITVCDHQTHDTLYRQSFSTLFQEWLATSEAKRCSKSFENTFLVPFPLREVDITVSLYDYHGQLSSTLTHSVNPNDILIQHTGEKHITPYEVLQQAADTTNCIHIAYVAEGYTEEEMNLFMDDCRTAIDALFCHEPFTSMRDRFQIVAVKSASKESGVSQPGNGIWRNTVLGSHFDTFYSVRYLTTLHLKRLHDILAGIPYEHIIILANTEHYGGGGIYNSYNLCYTRGDKFRPVVVHEFGHSFGGLGDEYPYGDEDPIYFPDIEPWEPNLTTRHDFHGKWENLIQQGKAGLVEGGGYMTHGVWRGTEDCRMRTNEEPEFCPVCQQALSKLIDFYTK